MRGISKELTAHDNQLVLLLTEGAADYERVGRYLAGGHVDGALIFSLHDRRLAAGDGPPGRAWRP